MNDRPRDLDDAALLDYVQRRTFRYFWDAAHPVSGLAYDRRTSRKGAKNPVDDPVAIGGSGFGAMALIVAAARGWIARDAAVERLGRMLELLSSARCYHGAFPHFMNGSTGETVPFGRKDDGADLVETSLLMMGLLCAREYFARPSAGEAGVRARISQLWEEVEWSWFTQDRDVLFWHWSPYNGWAIPEYIVMCESGGNWDAYNPSSGAAGPYQLMPMHLGGDARLFSREAQHAKAAELWAGGRGAHHWAACL